MNEGARMDARKFDEKGLTICPECQKLGLQIIGRIAVSKTAFKHIKMCKFCGLRIQE